MLSYRLNRAYAVEAFCSRVPGFHVAALVYRDNGVTDMIYEGGLPTRYRVGLSLGRSITKDDLVSGLVTALIEIPQ
ncbi:hypothetical protein [Gordonia sputi]